MAQGLTEAVKHAVKHQVTCDNADGKEYQRAENTQFFVLQRLNRLADDGEIIEAEVDAEEVHKYADYHLRVGAVMSDTVVEDGKSACTCRCKRVDDGIKEGHIKGKEDHFENSYADVDEIKALVGDSDWKKLPFNAAAGAKYKMLEKDGNFFDGL